MQANNSLVVVVAESVLLCLIPRASTAKHTKMELTWKCRIRRCRNALMTP